MIVLKKRLVTPVAVLATVAMITSAINPGIAGFNAEARNGEFYGSMVNEKPSNTFDPHYGVSIPKGYGDDSKEIDITKYPLMPGGYVLINGEDGNRRIGIPLGYDIKYAPGEEGSSALYISSIKDNKNLMENMSKKDKKILALGLILADKANRGTISPDDSDMSIFNLVGEKTYNPEESTKLINKMMQEDHSLFGNAPEKDSPVDKIVEMTPKDYVASVAQALVNKSLGIETPVSQYPSSLSHKKFYDVALVIADNMSDESIEGIEDSVFLTRQVGCSVPGDEGDNGGSENPGDNNTGEEGNNSGEDGATGDNGNSEGDSTSGETDGEGEGASDNDGSENDGEGTPDNGDSEDSDASGDAEENELYLPSDAGIPEDTLDMVPRTKARGESCGSDVLVVKDQMPSIISSISDSFKEELRELLKSSGEKDKEDKTTSTPKTTSPVDDSDEKDDKKDEDNSGDSNTDSESKTASESSGNSNEDQYGNTIINQSAEGARTVVPTQPTIDPALIGFTDLSNPHIPKLTRIPGGSSVGGVENANGPKVDTGGSVENDSIFSKIVKAIKDIF